MENNNRHLFGSALTGRGFVSYWRSHFEDFRLLYLLNGGTPAVQSLTIRLLGLALADRGFGVNYFHRAEYPRFLEGLTVPSRAAGVLSGGHPCAREGVFPPHLEVLDVALPGAPGGLSEGALGPGLNEALRLLQAAGETYERIRRRGGEPVDEGAVAARAAGWIEELRVGKPLLRHYFAGSVAAGGVRDFISHLSGFCRKRYVLRGAPGAGAVAVREVLIQALSRGCPVDACHSWINPGDLVLLLLPENGVAVVDGTCGYEPELLPGDVVWELESNLRAGAGALQREGARWQELNALLDEAGQILEASAEHLEKGAVYPPEEEVQKIVSRMVGAIAVPEGRRAASAVRVAQERREICL